VNGRHWSGPSIDQGTRVGPGTIDCGAEDGKLAAAHLQRVAVLVVSGRVAERPGQYVPVVGA